ncbi:MAG TPA: PLxRFG domain-containing protein [Acidimicrobiia bacterium]
MQSSRLPRRYIEGASRDLVRNTFDYVDSTSGYLARLDTNPEIEDGMAEMERRVEDISSRGTGSGEGARALSNEISARVLDTSFDNSDGAISRLTNRLTTASFVDNLASPGYSMVNALQVGMLTLPTLAGRFGGVKAAYHVNKAYLDVSAARIVGGGLVDTVKAVGGKKANGDRFIDDIKSRLKEKREVEMLDSLIEAGLIDANANLEIEKSIRQRGVAGTLIDAPLGYLENAARAVPQAVEAINRSVSALAAYRLMYNKTKDHNAAMQYAEDVVHESQGLYSNSNAAPIFNHPVGRLALQFKKYPQLVYYTLAKNTGRVLKPMNKGDRLAGIRTLAYIAASHGAMSGITGMLPWEVVKIPLMIFSGIAEALGEDAPDWEDFEDQVEEFTRQVTGDDTLAEMLTFGAPRGIGIDLNTRVGLQNLLIFGEPRGNDAEDWKSYLFDTFVGAPGRTVNDMAGGAVSLLEGDLDRAASGLIPVKMLADTSRAIGQSSAGRFSDSDFVLRVLGLQSARQANIGREIGQEVREGSFNRSQRRRLQQRYMRASGAQEVARAISAIRSFNSSLGEDERPINLNSLRSYRLEDVLRYRD